MNQADWTPSPVTEREAALLRRRVRWGPLNVWGAGFGSVGAMGALMVALSLIGQGVGVGPVALAFAAFGALAALPVWLAVRDNALMKAAKEPDQIKKEEFGAGTGWLVDLTILQGDTPTGMDRGMLWIEGGRLCFSGDRTSFALAPSQCAAACRKEAAILGLRRKTRLPLDVRTEAGRLALSWDVADDPSGDAARLCRGAVDAWAAKGGSEPGQFPPTRLGPGAPTRRRLALQAGLTTAWWSSILAVALALVASFEVFPALLVVLFGAAAGSALGCGQPRLRWRAWRDRRRLERGTR